MWDNFNFYLILIRIDKPGPKTANDLDFVSHFIIRHHCQTWLNWFGMNWSLQYFISALGPVLIPLILPMAANCDGHLFTTISSWMGRLWERIQKIYHLTRQNPSPYPHARKEEEEETLTMSTLTGLPSSATTSTSVPDWSACKIEWLKNDEKEGIGQWQTHSEYLVKGQIVRM